MALGWGSAARSKKGLRTALRLFPWVFPRFFAVLPKIPALHVPSSSYYLSNIAIFPPYQGKGLGGRLLCAVEEDAMAAGDTCVLLDVERKNVRALEFYRKNGYRPFQEFRTFVRMRKDLPREAGPWVTE